MEHLRVPSKVRIMTAVLHAVFAVLFLGERPSLRDWSGIACVALGVVILALKR